jgi:hypothetical protein
MNLKLMFGTGAIAAIALLAANPAIAQSVSSMTRNACIQRTAEEMTVATRDVSVVSAGPVSAESGARTLFMRNSRTGQTAECRINTIDNTVLSVTLGGGNTGGNSTGQNPEFWVAKSQTRFREKPGIFSKVVKGNVPKGTVLRNLGCQSTQTPTWCEVTYRDNPQFKGWVFSSDIEPYQAATTRPTFPATTTANPGDPVPGLNDLVGARAGQAERTVIQRGYELRNSRQVADSSVTYWMERGTGSCVAIRTTEGRYGAIVYTADRDCNRR